MVEYTNDGEFIATYWMPTEDNLQGAVKSGSFADGYNYDVRALPRHNVFFTSSFTGWSNYMMDLGKMMADPEAMKRFGNTVVVWKLHQRQARKVLDVPGAPLEIRCAWGPNHDYCFTTTALTSKIWLIYADESGEWQAKAVADIGDRPVRTANTRIANTAVTIHAVPIGDASVAVEIGAEWIQASPTVASR